MINSNNVKYYDRVLSHIYNSDFGQLELKEVAELCDGSKGLAEEIAEEFERREFIMDLKKSSCREGVTLMLISKPKVELFMKRGGFQARYNEHNPPKTKAQLLNDYFYMIVEKERIMRYEETTEEDNFNDTLLTLGLIKPNGSFYTLSKEGLLLSYSERTVQDFIKDNSFTPQSSNVTTVHGNLIQGSEFNNSTVNSTNTTNNSVNKIDGKGSSIKVNDATDSKTSLLEKISWIVGITAGAFAIWEFIIKN